MDEGEKTYSLIITHTAKLAYFELLHYLYEHYSIERATELAELILDAPTVLVSQPELGVLEESLQGRKYLYRYLLFKRTNRATVKIIYFVDKSNSLIYITDFFPTEKHPASIKKNF